MPITTFDELFEKLQKENQKLKEENQKNTSDIMGTLKNIQDEQARIHTRINELEEKVKKSGDECSKKTKNMKEDMKAIAVMHEKIVEKQDRLNRVNNIVIMGIPENDRDIGVLSDVMNILLPNNTLRLRTKGMRIGKHTEGKTRPLRVQLNSNNDVHAAMQNAKLLKDVDKYEQIYARMDQTKQQQQERRNYIQNKRAAGSDEEENEYSRPASKQRLMDTTPST
ncbi:unnamed protein product [Orchesella dallaii]|uniref:Uncharacterized protein n=1 Tax=Orchesella dallaii TaxID=48710 RepID=A0ABP1RKB0_9HEXA